MPSKMHRSLAEAQAAQTRPTGIPPLPQIAYSSLNFMEALGEQYTI